jgi:hypothetical protein
MIVYSHPREILEAMIIEEHPHLMYNPNKCIPEGLTEDQAKQFTKDEIEERLRNELNKRMVKSIADQVDPGHEI